MRRNEPLTLRQVEVLQWIGEGCPDGVWADFTYKTSTHALVSRGLVKVERRRKRWLAVLTDDGRFYLTHGRYPSEADPNSGTRETEKVSDIDDIAEQLFAELLSGEGQINVVSPTAQQRARYRRAIHHLITQHRIPEGFVLRHSGRDHGDLTIRLLREPARPQPQPPPAITVPEDNSMVVLPSFERLVDKCNQHPRGFCVPTLRTSTSTTSST